MIDQGALADPVPSAIFGLHVTSAQASGVIALRPGGLMASADRLRINVHGRQTHASMPWRGVDPVVTSAQIILALQTVITRQIESTATPAVLSISTIHGGVRSNILPDDVTMEGTLRVHDEAVRADIKRRITKTATTIADAGGATAEVDIGEGVPVTYNDPALRIIAIQPPPFGSRFECRSTPTSRRTAPSTFSLPAHSRRCALILS